MAVRTPPHPDPELTAQAIEAFRHIEGTMTLCGIIVGGCVAYLMESKARQTGRRGYLRFPFLAFSLIWYGFVLTGYIAAYVLKPVYLLGEWIPPTCEARMPFEGPDSPPCSLGRLVVWIFRFVTPFMGEDLGPFEPIWVDLGIMVGAALTLPLAGLLCPLLCPLPAETGANAGLPQHARTEGEKDCLSAKSTAGPAR